jgi:hypothetical protein
MGFFCREEGGGEGEGEWVASYHMTDPRKISTAKRRGLADKTAMLTRTIQPTFSP